MHIHMTKVISLSNTAYDEIKSLKESHESFSDVIIKLVENIKQRPLMDFFGKWPSKNEEALHIKKKLEKERSSFKTREVTF